MESWSTDSKRNESKAGDGSGGSYGVRYDGATLDSSTDVSDGAVGATVAAPRFLNYPKDLDPLFGANILPKRKAKGDPKCHQTRRAMATSWVHEHD